MTTKALTAMGALAQTYGLASEQNAAHVLTKTIFPSGKGTREEIIAFATVCNQYELNPFTKEIYAFPAKGGGIVPIVSVDGWLKLANRHPQFDGMECKVSGDGQTCTVTIWRKDRAHAFSWTEYLEEARRQTEPWKQMPRRMLANRTMCQAIRRAFSISGVYEPDEGEVIARGEMEKPAPSELLPPEIPDEPAEAEESPWPEREPEPVEIEPEPVRNEAEDDPFGLG